ncbi:MAG: type IX secretion system membrane protein PorP/SprF [Bacteroidia bacterium]
MKLLKIISLVLLVIAAPNSYAQSNLINNNKSMAFANPALQNMDFETGYVSTSLLLNPLSEESNFNSYLAIAEFKATEYWRIGFHGSTVENRLNKLDMYKLYTSYNFKMEEGSFLSLGLEVGSYKDQIKSDQFNRVYTPTHYEFTDSISNGIDIGLGFGYSNQGLELGLSLHKLNRPLGVPFPVQRWQFVDSTNRVVKKDTSITWGEEDFLKYSIQATMLAIYKWEPSKNTKLIHSLHVVNPTANGVDYISFQNFLEFNKKFTIGLGIYENGSLGYMGSLSYQIGSSIRIEGTAFFHQDAAYNPNAEYPVKKTDKGYLIIASGAYEDQGMIPSFEANLSFQF